MHALITGASSGIGEALAVAFANAGYDVTLVARRQAELERVASATGGRTKVQCLPYDLSDLGGIEDLVAKAEAGLGPIDALVNNAGIQVLGHAHEVTIAETDRQFAVNLQAPLRLSKAVVPGMIARRTGAIVDIASLAAITHVPYMGYYSASKAALAAASITLRAELRAHGVHVLTVYPGPVRTPMAHTGANFYESDGPLPWGTPEQLADRILTALRQRQGTLVYPRFYYLSRWFPRVSQWVTEKMAPKPRQQAVPLAEA